MSATANAIDAVQSCIRSLDMSMDELKSSLEAVPSNGDASSGLLEELKERQTKLESMLNDRGEIGDEIEHYMSNSWEFSPSDHDLLDESDINSNIEAAIDNIGEEWTKEQIIDLINVTLQDQIGDLVHETLEDVKIVSTIWKKKKEEVSDDA